MIIPTELASLSEENFREYMRFYIRRHFGEVIGRDGAALLERKDGFDLLAEFLDQKKRVLRKAA